MRSRIDAQRVNWQHSWESEVESKPKPCEWHAPPEWEQDYWETACGEAFCFTDGGPSDNRMRFCPYCGGELIEVQAATKEEDE